MSGQARAMEPEDVTRLLVEHLNAGDAAGVGALHEPDAPPTALNTIGDRGMRSKTSNRHSLLLVQVRGLLARRWRT